MAASSDFASWRGLRINAHAPCQMRIVRGKAIDLAQLRYASDVVGHRIAPNRTACGLGGRVFCARGPPPLRQIAPTGALCFTTVGPGSNALYAEVFSHWTPRIRHHVKEFYLLDDQKFSTSRGHAARARRLWAQRQVDVVRTHSALVRPQGELDALRRGNEPFQGILRYPSCYPRRLYRCGSRR